MNANINLRVDSEIRENYHFRVCKGPVDRGTDLVATLHIVESVKLLRTLFRIKSLINLTILSKLGHELGRK